MSRTYPDARQRRRLRRKYGWRYVAWVETFPDRAPEAALTAMFTGDVEPLRDLYNEGLSALVGHLVIEPVLRDCMPACEPYGWAEKREERA